MHVLGVDRAGLYARSEGLDTARGADVRAGALPAVRGHAAAAPDGPPAVPPARPAGAAGRVRPPAGDRGAGGGTRSRRSATARTRWSSTWARGPAPSRSRSSRNTRARRCSRPICRAEAVALAGENAATSGLDVTVLEGDLLEPLPPDLRGWVDLVVSNPPYVPAADLEDLPAEVRADPSSRCSAAPTSIGGSRAEAAVAPRPAASVAVEIGATEGDEVSLVLSERFGDVEVEPDLAVRDRVVARPAPMTPRSTTIERAARAALADELIVMPTDTVYGIGTRPDDPRRRRGCSRRRGARAIWSSRCSCPKRGRPSGSPSFDERAEALAPGSGRARSRSCCRSAELARLGPGRRPADHRRPDAARPARARGAGANGPARGDEREPQRRSHALDLRRGRGGFRRRGRGVLCAPEPLVGSASTVIDLAHGEPVVVRVGAVSERVDRRGPARVAATRGPRGAGVDSRPHGKGAGGVHGQRVSVAARRGVPASRDSCDRMGRASPQVASAGTTGWTGSGADPHSIQAAAEHGIDISGHRARVLDRVDIASSSLILAMANEHVDSITSAAPSARSKTFTLKEFVRLLEAIPRTEADASDPIAARVEAADELRRAGFAGDPHDEGIADPLGLPLEAFRLVADEIEVWCARTRRRPRRLARCARRGIRGVLVVRISIGCDHAGYPAEGRPEGVRPSWGTRCSTSGRTDGAGGLPAFCANAAREVVDGRADRGMVFGGSGQGEQLAANKVKGARAALCNDLHLARAVRAGTTTRTCCRWAGASSRSSLAEEIVQLWLETAFDGGRHARRLEQVAEIERGER